MADKFKMYEGIKVNNTLINAQNYPDIRAFKFDERMGEEVSTRGMGDSFDKIDQDGYWIIINVKETVPSDPQLIIVKGFSRGTAQWALLGSDQFQSIDTLPTEEIVFIYLW